MAPTVGAHDRVADGVERDLCALLFLEQRLCDRRALDHAAQGLRQQVAVEAGLQEIVLRSMLYRQLGDFLVLRSAQDQDRNLGRGAKEPIEGLDSVAVGQEEVDQYRRDAVRSLLSFPRQAFQALGAASDPFDLEGPIARVDQRFSNGLGIRGIVLDQKYVLRHEILPEHRDARPGESRLEGCRRSSTPDEFALAGRRRPIWPSTIRPGLAPALPGRARRARQARRTRAPIPAPARQRADRSITTISTRRFRCQQVSEPSEHRSRPLSPLPIVIRSSSNPAAISASRTRCARRSLSASLRAV